MKKVSIVVPVYNAEKYLGYCINSILSQTYTNLEVILVNDGSVDSSLEICRNYAEIDSRVRIIDVENGGVSKARNLGIDYATGEYLQFVDSDDCIALDMVEKMVSAVENYQMDLAVCSFQMVTLENKLPIQIQVCTSKGLGQECVLTREAFFEKMPTILWKTAMLECSWNKIFKTDLMKKNHIRFAEGISLGEDFLMNMKYFSACNGAVLLSDELYYYMQINDQALTKIYRKDLFENQMMLIDRFQELVEQEQIICEQEEISLAEYRVVKVIQCMCNLFHEGAGLTKAEIKSFLAVMVNDERVRSAIEKSKYIDPKYEWIREQYKYSDVGTIYNNLKLASEVDKEQLIREDQAKAGFGDEETSELIRNPGIINKCLVWCINRILAVCQIRKLEMVRNTLIDHGIKAAVVKSLTYHKKSEV